MRITNIRINGIDNPAGFFYEKLIFSWNVRDTVSKRQTNAVIEVSDSGDFKTILCKKEGPDLKQGGERLDMNLRQQCHRMPGMGQQMGQRRTPASAPENRYRSFA